MKKTKLVWEDGTWLFKAQPDEREIAAFSSKEEALRQAAATLKEKAPELVFDEGIPLVIQNPDGTTEEVIVPVTGAHAGG